MTSPTKLLQAYYFNKLHFEQKLTKLLLKCTPYTAFDFKEEICRKTSCNNKILPSLKKRETTPFKTSHLLVSTAHVYIPIYLANTKAIVLLMITECIKPKKHPQSIEALASQVMGLVFGLW